MVMAEPSVVTESFAMVWVSSAMVGAAFSMVVPEVSLTLESSAIV